MRVHLDARVYKSDTNWNELRILLKCAVVSGWAWRRASKRRRNPTRE